MKILNLTNLETSEIKYEVSKFPDGQQQVTIKDFESGDNFKWKQELLAYPVTIKSRLNSFMDLELIVCAKKALDVLGFNNINLYVPYFLGSRSDRQFEIGSNNYLKDVICPIINSLKFDSITVIDPHSDILEACLNNFKKEDNSNLVNFAFHSIFNSNLGYSTEDLYKNKIIISPDAGANKKIYKLAEQIEFKGDIVTCSKSRGVDGKLTKTVVPYSKLLDFKDVVIIDDICDGGATFINIVKEINKLEEKYSDKPRIKKYLIVTHGIFSKGFKDLSKYFDGIYCTNSYRDIEEYIWDGDKKGIPTRVKQLNIFK